MRIVVVCGCAALLLAPVPARAQSDDQETRAALIERTQAEKSTHLQPYVPNKAEKYLDYAENYLTTGMRWHPFFDSAYSGGGFTLGAGYRRYVGSYNTVDFRGSLTPSGYKRVEGEFLAPRLLKRQAVFSVIGGWREATQVGFYGLGTTTTKADRANYGFKQPYGLATFNVRPVHRRVLLRLGAEASQWQQTPGAGEAPSVEEIYTPQTVNGLGATVRSWVSTGPNESISPAEVQRALGVASRVMAQ